MTPVRPRALLSGVLVALAAFVTVIVAPHPTPARASLRVLLSALTPAPPPRAALPAGFSAAIDVATRASFVSVVADDIDRDGDLDVVASVGTLDLEVWRNDGAGHFSRIRSTSHQALRAQPPAPALDGDDAADTTGIQNDQQRSLRLDRLDAAGDAGPDAPHFSLVRPSHASFSPPLRPSRAPPIA